MYSKAPKSCALKGLASARDSLLGNARISLVKSLLSCPANLQWKVWLAGARLELSAGSLAKARRCLPLLSTVPCPPIICSNDHHMYTATLSSLLLRLTVTVHAAAQFSTTQFMLKIQQDCDHPSSHLVSFHSNCSTSRSLLCQAFKTVPAKSRFHVFLECSRVEVWQAPLNQHHYSDFLLHI
jgi:hypothetical protein